MTKYMKGRENGKLRIIPGFGLSVGITLLILTCIVIVPLTTVVLYAMRVSPVEFMSILLSESIRYSIIVSVVCSVVAALINGFFGFIIAWSLVRYEFRWKTILDSLIDIPFAMPTAIAGITLSKMYSNTGVPGKFLSDVGINVSYSHSGIVVAMVFVGVPFVIRNLQPVLEKIDPSYEEAAAIFGVGKTRIFFRIILPEILPAWITGVGMSFARGIGEYGSIVYIAGNSAREHTQVASYIIMQRLNNMDYTSAAVVAVVLLLISIVSLMISNAVQIMYSRRVKHE